MVVLIRKMLILGSADSDSGTYPGTCSAYTKRTCRMSSADEIEPGEIQHEWGRSHEEALKEVHGRVPQH